MKIKILLCILCLTILTGCTSTIQMTNIQQKQLKQYIIYSNNLIEEFFKNDQNPRQRLEPYRTRYRLIQPLLDKLENNKK